jgi:hypothetical protein
MPGIESFGRGRPKSDPVTRFFSEPIVFTDEGHAAIERNLDSYRSLMRAEASEGGEWCVHARLKDAMTAQGLYYYAEDLLSFFRFEEASDEEAANMLHKAMIAKMKCLKMFPLPILMYEIGVLLDALGAPEASTMFTSFLDAQSRFASDQFDKILLDTVKSDITTATVDARNRLRCPVQDAAAKPSEPQPNEDCMNPKCQAFKERLKNVKHSPAVRDWALNHSVSDPTLDSPLSFPRRPTPQAPLRAQKSAKVVACIRTIESEMLKRPLSDQEENVVAELCGALLKMALGDEKIVIRLVKLEWRESTDVLDAFRRAHDRWERDHNRLG